MDSTDLRSLEEELANLDPEDLRYLSQLIAEDAPAVQNVIRNALEEPIPEGVNKKLKTPLKPKPYQPTAPPRKRNRRQQLLRQFDPIQPNSIRNVADNQNEIMNLFEDTEFEGE